MRSTDYCIPLVQATLEPEVGGKARNLQRLMALGMPVPDGFVLTNSAFDELCSDAKDDDRLLSAALPADLAPALDSAYARLAAGRVIVRSSAVGEDSAAASFAGQLDSIPDVTNRAELTGALLRCWASRWSERALAYERARGIRLNGMGAIVQRQVEAAVSGVLFTEAPDGRGDRMMAEYCAGLGEALVSGRANPGRVTMSREHPRWSLETPPDERFEDERLLLTDARFEELRHLGRVIESAFGAPQDIEWSIDRAGRMWILQARPITCRRAADSTVLWSNANVNENFPQPISPLLYSIASAGYYHYFLNLGRAFGLSRRRLTSIEDPLRHIIGVHGARMYYNLSSIHEVLRAAPFGDHLAESFNRFVGVTEMAPARDGARRWGQPPFSPPRQEKGDSPRRRRLSEWLELAVIAVKTTWQYAFVTRRVTEFERVADEYADRTAPATLATLSRRGLLECLRGFLEIRCHRWKNASLADAGAMVCYAVLQKLLARAFPERDQQALHNTLLKALPGLVSGMPPLRLWELSRLVRADERLHTLIAEAAPADALRTIRTDPRFSTFASAFDAYVDTWGFRCSAELMLTVPSFQDDPGPLIEFIRAYAALDTESPHDLLRRQQSERIAETARVLTALGGRPVFRTVPFLRQSVTAGIVLRWTQSSIQLRERARLKQALLYTRFRRVALAIGDALAAEGLLDDRHDVFLFTAAELDALLSGSEMFPHSIRALATLRRDAHARLSRSQPPDTIRLREGEYLPADGSAESVADPTTQAGSAALLHGTGACGGRTSARAAILTDVTQASRLQPGDVLVTRQTDPGWGPVFPLISGLVIERGGMLSHGAIIAREFGIPSVVGVKDATRLIPDGAIICVDGDRGTVRVGE
jgi:phosphohistidine swiveling domain-containing protein